MATTITGLLLLCAVIVAQATFPRPTQLPSLNAYGLPLPYSYVQNAKGYVTIGGQLYAILDEKVAHVPQSAQPAVGVVQTTTHSTSTQSQGSSLTQAAQETQSAQAAEATQAAAQATQAAAQATQAAAQAAQAAVQASQAAQVAQSSQSYPLPQPSQAPQASGQASVVITTSAPSQPEIASTVSKTPQIDVSSGPTIYLSPNSNGGQTANSQQTILYTVSNTNITVHRTETVYSLKHPPQQVSAPVTVTFTKDGNSPPIVIPLKTVSTTPFTISYTSSPSQVQTSGPSLVPSSVAVQPSSSTYQNQAIITSRPSFTFSPSASSYALQGPTLGQGNPVVQVENALAELMRLTTAQRPGRPGLQVQVDPVAQASYYVDAQGRRIDLSAPGSSAAPSLYQTAPPEPLQLQSNYNYRPSGDQMTRLEPQSLSSSIEQPLRVTIPTGRASSQGPASPLSPGDEGPFRGDSVQQ